MHRKWWQDTIIYQVYLRSFKDTNNDGIGDLQGVVEKLDYLKALGVDTLWISPHYDSPMDDNGYDVRHFQKVSDDYGTLEDFKTLVNEAHQREMRIVTDLVLNHTSDEHPWFEAAKDPSHPDHEQYHDYYIWHEGHTNEEGERVMPTRWRSWFGGPVWEYNEATDSYYLHIFSKKMPDLNWRNAAMRAELKAMIQWWIDLGVDGFRIDASNHIEKNWDFPDDYPGYHHFSSLPKHHDYLSELGEELFIPNDLLILGESGGASKEEALQYAGFDSTEFNMLIHFGHVWADIDPHNEQTPGKWAKGKTNLVAIKEALAHWINVFHGKGWNTLYWHNHDHPRVVSHYGNDDILWHEKSAKMLAVMLYLLPGTPIVYQGEEIGMTNVDYTELSDFRDVEVFTEYENFMRLGTSHEVAMQALRDRARDNARSPMQWDTTLHAGFSEHPPWMKVNQNFPLINVKLQQRDPNSIWSLYQQLLQLRKTEQLSDALPTFYLLEDPNLVVYHTQGAHHDYVVSLNFQGFACDSKDVIDVSDYELYYTNEPHSHEGKLQPYEARIYRRSRP